MSSPPQRRLNTSFAATIASSSPLITAMTVVMEILAIKRSQTVDFSNDNEGVLAAHFAWGWGGVGGVGGREGGVRGEERGMREWVGRNFSLKGGAKR